MKHVYGTSCEACEEKLKDGDPLLLKWFRIAKLQFPDLHVSWVHRGESDQNDFFQKGLSHDQWPNSPHNKMPSLAMDIFCQTEQGVYDGSGEYCRKINDYLISMGCADIVWGGTWVTLKDLDHFQLR